MCGIVGVAGNLELKDVDIFKELLHIDYIRGKAATGVGSVSSTREIEVFKRACDPVELQLFTRFGTVVNSSKKVLIGHNRAPTHGANNQFNAHPFVFDNIMGVHNGTLELSAMKALDHKDWFDTDSEQLYWNINQHGVEEAVSRISGAWSLVYYNKENNTINFLRNEERPMFYCFTKDRKRMYWASELWMLQGILNRNRVETEDKMWTTATDTNYSWTVPSHGQVFGEAARFPCKGKARVPTIYGGHAYGDWDWRKEKREREERNAAAEEARKKAEEERKAKDTEDKVVVPFVMQEQNERLLLPPPSGTSSSSLKTSTVISSDTTIGVGGLIKPNSLKIIDEKGQQIPPATLERLEIRALRKAADGKWRPPYYDRKGNILPRFRWNRAVQDGCINCGHSPSWGEYCKFGPDLNVSSGSIVFVCEKCALDPEIVKIAMTA